MFQLGARNLGLRAILHDLSLFDEAINVARVNAVSFAFTHADKRQLTVFEQRINIGLGAAQHSRGLFHAQ